jgi:23S rRNA (uracil1939-C5)-methyltransferase/tRNA (uracil-5-)-methyltransferase
MVDQVVEHAAAEGMTHSADCCCGLGLFGVTAAKHFDRAVGIEINSLTTAEATANTKANGVTNVEFKAASAKNVFSVIADFPRETAAVVLDPTRKGCSENFLQQLHEFKMLSPCRAIR